MEGPVTRGNVLVMRINTEPSIELNAYNLNGTPKEDNDAEEPEEEEETTLTEIFIENVLHYQDAEGNLYDEHFNLL
jgi:hypothetical protein